jgi:peptidylprolyl isomerase
MTDSDLFTASIGAAAVACLIAWALWPDGSIPTDDTDGDGPNVVIEMGGGAEGYIVIDLYDDIAPQHAERIIELTEAGKYDGVAFHRVIEGFMAQTGDVQYGNVSEGDLSRAGYGMSELPNLPAEFSDIQFTRGMVGMARSADPDSANSQFFIMLDRAASLDNQYTIVGHVVAGMNVVDAIKLGDSNDNGKVEAPDFMAQVTIQR